MGRQPFFDNFPWHLAWWAQDKVLRLFRPSRKAVIISGLRVVFGCTDTLNSIRQILACEDLVNAG